jgi:TPR repeat protein
MSPDRDGARAWGLLRTVLLAGVAALTAAGCVSRPTTTPTRALAEARDRSQMSAEDYYEMGRAYETGNGVPRDLNRAVELFEIASRRGEPRASERLGLLAARGDVALEDARTYDRLLAASLRQSGSATLELARLQLTGAQGAPHSPEQAIRALESLAAGGDPAAMADLARILTDPAYDRLDYARAERLLTDAHARGRADAALNLARLYATPGTPMSNPGEARRWAEVAAARGQPGAWMVLGVLAGDPSSPAYDPVAAEQAYQRAIDSGVPEARLGLAKLQESTGRLDAALASYQQLVSEGMADIGYEAGRLLDDHFSSRRGEAYAYFESSYAAGRAAAPRRLLNMLEDDVRDPDGNRGPALAIVRSWADQVGDPQVHYRLGRLLENGPTELRNPQQAIAYYRRAADGGNAQAALHVARLLGGGPDAAAYYQRAASLGDPDALYELARAQEARGDLAGAAGSYAAAARAGDSDAAVRLARLTTQNPDLGGGDDARVTLERASEAGDANARLALADMLYQSGVAQDRGRAVRLFREAAEAGNARAMRRMGDLAEDGVGGMTVADAASWFERAVLAGDQEAAYRLLRNAVRHGQSPAAIERALEFATPAAQAGDPTVAYWYGVALIELNRPEEAAEWLIAAQSQGVEGALEELLTLTEDNPELETRIGEAAGGEGCAAGRYALIQADQSAGAESAELYQQALDAGWYVAADRLGRLHMTGLATGAPDLELAYAYFSIAAAGGVNGAADAASDVSAALTPARMESATALQGEMAAALPGPCAD